MSDRIKRPAFQWYPGDHRRDTALQLCSFEARALWRDMLDVMHEGTPYGHLAAGGEPITPVDLARISGLTPARVTKYLGELAGRRVFSRTAEGVIYSRRMVRDEHLRTVRAEAGKQGGNPALLGKGKDKQEGSGLDKQTPNQKLTPSSSSASAPSLANYTLSDIERAARKELVAELPGDFHVDLDAMLGTLPPGRRLFWLRSLLRLIRPTTGKVVHRPEDVGEALRQFGANGGDNWAFFEGHLRRVATPPEPNGPAHHGGRLGSRETAGQEAYETALAVAEAFQRHAGGSR